MKFKQIEKIAKKISKKHGYEGQVTIEKDCSEAGELYAEVRTELTLADGGTELLAAVLEKLGYEGGYAGACVYNFYDNQE